MQEVKVLIIAKCSFCVLQIGNMQALKELKRSTLQLAASNGCLHTPVDASIFDPEKDVDDLLPVEVKEQRLSNLLQSLMVGGCLGAMPLLKKIPTSVLWGYFAYMAIDSLHGSQFWERILLLFTPPSRRYKYEYYLCFQLNVYILSYFYAMNIFIIIYSSCG